MRTGVQAARIRAGETGPHGFRWLALRLCQAYDNLLGNTEGIDRDVAVWVITNAQSRVQLGSVTIPFPCVVGEMDPERYKSVFSHFLLPLTDLFNKAPAESVVGIEFDFAATDPR